MEGHRRASAWAILFLSVAIYSVGIVLLLVAETQSNNAMFVVGTILFLASMVIYYLSGDPRHEVEARFKRLAKWQKLLVILGSSLPWIVL
jgi:hypothetical protein